MRDGWLIDRSIDVYIHRIYMYARSTHLLLHHARLVGVEGEALAGDELLLQLLLALPPACVYCGVMRVV